MFSNCSTSQTSKPRFKSLLCTHFTWKTQGNSKKNIRLKWTAVCLTLDYLSGKVNESVGTLELSKYYTLLQIFHFEVLELTALNYSYKVAFWRFQLPKERCFCFAKTPWRGKRDRRKICTLQLHLPEKKKLQPHLRRSIIPPQFLGLSSAQLSCQAVWY